MPVDPVDDVRRRARRFGLQVAGALVALLAVLGAVAYTLYERNEHTAAENRLAEVAKDVTPSDELDGTWVAVKPPDAPIEQSAGLPSGLPLADPMQQVAQDGRPRMTEAEIGPETYFVRTLRREDGSVVQAVIDGTDTEAASGRMVASLLAAGGVGVVLVALLAALLARRTLEPLTEALRMQRRFVGDASHELRTPLTLLSTRLQLLARRLRGGPALTPEAERDLAGVLEDTAALTGILEDLLLAASPGDEVREPCEVGGLVGPVLRAAAATAADRGVDLRLGTVQEGTVAASPAALRRAVTSLVDNALDHARSVVEVEVRAGRRDVEVHVSDDGPGVPPDQARRMFERFSSTRSGAPDLDGRRHYGLGLALVADVATAHRGSVAVRSPEGRPGATLVLTLPRLVQTTSGG